MGGGDSHPRSGEERRRGEVPRGYVAVRVGEEDEDRRRFVLPLTHLSHPLFAPLLREAAEEFGFHHDGAVTFPCSAAEFLSVLALIERELLHPHHGGAASHRHHHIHLPHHLVGCFRA